MYNQPNIFIDDAKKFIEEVNEEMNQIESQKIVSANAEVAAVQIGLMAKNKDIKEKMLTLMDLTKAVLVKIKAQERSTESAPSPLKDAKLNQQLEMQLDALDKRTEREYAVIKKQQDIKTQLFRDLERNEKEGDRYQFLQNELS